MKKITSVIISLFVIVSITKAQDEYYFDKFRYDQFVSWMQAIEVPGFNLSDTETEGTVEVYNIEYVGMFTNEQYDFVQARIGHPDIFYQFEDLPAYKVVGPYELNGYPAVFIYNEKLTKPQNATYLLVKLEKLNATFSISVMTKDRLTQQEMENIFKNFNLQLIEDNKIASWPDEIDISIRIPGLAESIEKIKTSDPEVKAAYKAVFRNSNEFVIELKRFFDTRKGWLDLTSFKNINLLCTTTTNMKELEKLPEGEIIEFIYYVK